MCAFWRWGAVLHVNIIVAIGVKLASEKMKEIAIFVSKQIRSPFPAMVESNDIARLISAHKAFANWLTEEIHWILCLLLLFITAVPNTKLCAWGEEDSGGHVL